MMSKVLIEQDTIDNAIADFDSIKTAIANKGVFVPANTPTNQYGNRIAQIPTGGETPSVYIIPKPDESVVGSYYVALAYGSLGKDEASSDISIVYGNATTVTNLCSATAVRNINCFTDTSLMSPVVLMNTQILGIYFGSLFTATSISNYFMHGCVNFNQPLDLPDSIKTLGNYFLYRCTKYNFPAPDLSKYTIGTYFMANCSAFNHPITIPTSMSSLPNYFIYALSSYNHAITIPNSITSIGDNAISELESYNRPIIIPESIKTIGVNFLRNCIVYNYPITIPETMESIGGYFMYGVNAMTSKITYNSLAMPNDAGSFASGSAYALMYLQGIPIGGKYAEELLLAHPNSTAASTRRNLYLAT